MIVKVLRKTMQCGSMEVINRLNLKSFVDLFCSRSALNTFFAKFLKT